jgi:hypothetical protein
VTWAAIRRGWVALTLFLLALVLLATAVSADTLAKGDSELSLVLDWASVDRDDRSDSDEEVRATLGYGRMLTDAHEIGGEIFYTQENDFDGIGLGVFYHYNFAAQGTLNPFLGANLVHFEGDLGDLWDRAYGLFAGVKVYPYEHAGCAFGASYHWLQGAETGFDATQASLFASLRVKF